MKRETNYSLLPISVQCSDIYWEAGPEYAQHLVGKTDTFIMSLPLLFPLTQFLLLSMTLYGMEWQFEPAALAMSTLYLLPTPTYWLLWVVGWKGSLNDVSILLSGSQNIDAVSCCSSYKYRAQQCMDCCGDS